MMQEMLVLLESVAKVGIVLVIVLVTAMLTKTRINISGQHGKTNFSFQTGHSETCGKF